jgi:hypothetical protein
MHSGTHNELFVYLIISLRKKWVKSCLTYSKKINELSYKYYRNKKWEKEEFLRKFYEKLVNFVRQENPHRSICMAYGGVIELSIVCSCYFRY